MDTVLKKTKEKDATKLFKPPNNKKTEDRRKKTYSSPSSKAVSTIKPSNSF